MKDAAPLKQKLYDQCMSYVQTRMHAARQAIEDAQAAAHDDTKSSAGDKYETGREMMQQETDRNLTQLNEANKLLVALNKINPAVVADKGEIGSVVFTDKGIFFIAISAGVLTAGSERYFAVSPASPIGLKLLGQKMGDEFKLNDKIYHIRGVI